MLNAILPYELEPLRVSMQTPVACEIWFVEEADDLPATPPVGHLWVDVSRMIVPDLCDVMHS